VAEQTEEENVSNEQGFFSQGDYEAWKAQRAASQAAAARRTLEEHDAHLRQLGTGDADHMAKLAKHTYMLEHGLEYRDQQDGRMVLTWAPSTVYSESSWEARQRHAAVETQERHVPTVSPPTPQDGSHGAMLGGHAIAGGVVSQASASGRMFARSDILAIVRGQKALATAFQAREALDALARIIANLEE
jgi:hypothetical protein